MVALSVAVMAFLSSGIRVAVGAALLSVATDERPRRLAPRPPPVAGGA